MIPDSKGFDFIRFTDNCQFIRAVDYRFILSVAVLIHSGNSIFENGKSSEPSAAFSVMFEIRSMESLRDAVCEARTSRSI